MHAAARVPGPLSLQRVAAASELLRARAQLPYKVRSVSTTDDTLCVANLGGPGIRMRQRMAIRQSAIAIAFLGVTIYYGGPRLLRLVVAVPVLLAAFGYFQAREKT